MLKITDSQFRQIVDHAREGAPLEVCGILAGLDNLVLAVYRMRNTDDSSMHFTMDPREHAEVLEDLSAKGMEMIAFYHSHPADPRYPSAEDIRLAFYPDVISVIVSLEEPDAPVVAAYSIMGGVVETVEMQVTAA